MKQKTLPRHTFFAEFGGTKVACGVADRPEFKRPQVLGEPLTVPSLVAQGPEASARQGLIHMAKAAQVNGIPLASIPLIAATIPAPIDLRTDGGATVVELSNLQHPKWPGTDFAKLIRELAAGGSIGTFHPDLRVYVDNDAKCAGAGVLREFDPGVVKRSTFVCLFFGTGVGGVTIHHGEIVRGCGLAGEPGGTPIDFPNEATYWNGKRRSRNIRLFEHFAARMAFERQLKQIFETESRFTLHPLRNVFPEPGEDCTEWQKRAGKVRTIANDWIGETKHDVNEGDLCIRLFDGQAEAIGIYLAPLVMMLNPNFIVIGGGLTDPSIVSQGFIDRLLGNITKHLDNNVPMKNLRSTSPWGYKLYIPKSGDFAAVNGVVDLANSFWWRR